MSTKTRRYILTVDTTDGHVRITDDLTPDPEPAPPPPPDRSDCAVRRACLNRALALSWVGTEDDRRPLMPDCQACRAYTPAAPLPAPRERGGNE